MNEITSKDNNLIKHVKKLIKSAKYRRESQQFVAEGLRICTDAYLSGASIDSLIISKTALGKNHNIIDKIADTGAGLYTVSDSVYNSISDTKSPQGILCVIKTLDKSTLFDKIKIDGNFLALDNVQDPSNLGTILRTAEAIGIDGIIMSDDCCDIYSPKVVRGSMGAVFRLPYIIVGSIAGYLKNHKDLKSFAAVVDKCAVPITDVDFSGCSVLAIGNEGNGLKPETVSACGTQVTIPMKGRAESLNAAVAASIAMWEMIK